VSAEMYCSRVTVTALFTLRIVVATRIYRDQRRSGARLFATSAASLERWALRVPVCVNEALWVSCRVRVRQGFGPR
jgi:hypothetical protein